jgi:hypothetical protein
MEKLSGYCARARRELFDLFPARWAFIPKCICPGFLTQSSVHRFFPGAGFDVDCSVGIVLMAFANLVSFRRMRLIKLLDARYLQFAFVLEKRREF